MHRHPEAPRRGELWGRAPSLSARRRAALPTPPLTRQHEADHMMRRPRHGLGEREGHTAAPGQKPEPRAGPAAGRVRSPCL